MLAYQLTEEVIKTTYEHEKFLTEVIGDDSNTKGKKIAIIGEPGAGKSTLLEKIGKYLKEHDALPIYIPLSNLSGDTLKEYLLNRWLENPITPNQLQELLQLQRVWFLLDGLDEMQAASSVDALNKISQDISKLGAARVVLTCRLNVWDASTKNLLDFQNFKTQEFSSKQVRNFILAWFQRAEEAESEVCHSERNVSEAKNLKNPSLSEECHSEGNISGAKNLKNPSLSEECHSEGNVSGAKNLKNPSFPKTSIQQGEQLWQKLNESGRERLLDLVKNPLRLALMCQVWDTTKDLPETQAALYKRFTLYHYEWKQTEFPTTLAQQNELNSALGKLAQKAIASGKTRFRIGQNFAYRVMGENLFDRACRLGWLNQVDRDKQTEEPFYAFYHATFQEYFAALAIDDWHFLLNHVLNNPSQGIYRIFEPQWKQVILLWLGCEKVEPEQKEQFIKALIEFNDECGEFYQYRAYFLAAAGIAEFRDCSKADEIVEQIAKWSFGYFNENYQWLTFIEPIADQAKEALQQTEREKAIQKLVQLINSVVGQREYTHYLVAESLVKIGVGSPIAIKLLKQIIGSAKDEYILRLTANCLGKIDPGNQIAIEKLEQLINLTEEQFTLGNLTEEQFTLGNLTEEQFTLGLLVHNLLEIESGNPIAIQKLLQIIESAKDESTLWQAAENLGRIEIGNPVAIHALKRIIKSATNTYTLYLAADSLGKISPGNSTAIQTLVPLMKSAKTDRYDLRGNIAWSLVKIGTDNIIVAIEELLKLIESTDDALTRYLAVDSLKKLEPHHSRAIQELEKLIQFSNDEYTCCLAASSLVKDNPEHTEALSKLKQFLQSNDESIRYIAIECLLQIDSLNQKVVKQLEHILMATSNMSIRSQSIETLKKCIQNEHLTVIIENWKEYLSHETYKKNLSLFHLSYKLIWHCAQNMPYLSFYQAWHH